MSARTCRQVVGPDGRASQRRPKARTIGERITQTLAFETIGLVVVTPAYRAATDATLFDSMTLMLAVGAVAAIWCVVFDALFEWVGHSMVQKLASRRQNCVRMLKAAVREATEIPVTLPVIYVLTDMSWRDSLLTDIALAVVYVIYGFLFFCVIDRLRSSNSAEVAATDR